jgi:hypothetical protein
LNLLDLESKLKYHFTVLKRVAFAVILVFVSLFAFCEEWYELEVKIITTGNNQQQKEIGSFGAEIPNKGKGTLKRVVTITNKTKNKSNEIEFETSLEPQRDDRGFLHLVVTSKAKPKIGNEDNRFRDLRYDNPTNQIVEIFSDQETGTHLLLAISVKPKEETLENIKDLKVNFRCRVEKSFKNTSEQVDFYDLQSIGDSAVERKLTKSVPVWVKGEYGEVAVSGFTEIDSSKTPVQIKAGEGFSYTPPKKDAKLLKKKVKKDSRIPIIYQAGESSKQEVHQKDEKVDEIKKKEESQSIDWEKEEFNYSIKVIEAKKGQIKIVISLSGNLYDPDTKTLKTLQPKEEEKLLSTGEIATATIFNEEKDGYTLTIQPQF